MTPDNLPTQIGLRDKLGRREFSEKRAKKGRATVNRFKPLANDVIISADRLGFVSTEEMTTVARQDSGSRGSAFQGWYVLSASDFEEVKCQVHATPTDSNPYHADIAYPVSPFSDTEEGKDFHRELGQMLSLKAKFCPAHPL